MKTLYIANLKTGWHKDILGLTEEAHEVLEDIRQIYIYGVSSIADAKQSIEDGYYVYLPSRWDDDYGFSNNIKDLMNFCELIKDIRNRAFCLMVDPTDVTNVTAVDVSDDFYTTVTSVDYEDIRINDIEAVKKITNLVEMTFED